MKHNVIELHFPLFNLPYMSHIILSISLVNVLISLQKKQQQTFTSNGYTRTKTTTKTHAFTKERVGHFLEIKYIIQAFFMK